MSETKWSKDIVNDLNRVNTKHITLTEFVNKHWEEFKPVYINFHKCCPDEAELYLLVYEFFSKIVRADVQPLFNSDNQLFSYFKTAVRNKHYDNTHKKEVELISFDDYFRTDPEDEQENLEDKIPDPEAENMDEKVFGEMWIDKVFSELSEVLPEPYIKTMALLYKGLTQNEVRKELGVNKTTVTDRIWKIREALQDLGIYPPK